ncbi:MAG: short-chain dehydrogenase/reductase [Conexibacter sp.]|nr:short-chain dehydrogenase/reductase [Conexibacter sp.]
MNITHDFRGRTVLVTGAARGIGLAIAETFAAAQADVVMIDRDEEELRAAAADLDATPVVADVSCTADVDRVVTTTAERTGSIDVLVNNAGILRDAVLWKLTDEDWDAVMAVHLGGTFRFTRACVPYFRAQRNGRVVNVTSYSGLHGNVGQANYASAKAGIIGFTKTAAKELARFGVTVNAISPNAETRMIASIPEDRKRASEQLIPMGRYADPSEISAAVAFLASDEAGYVTGTVLPVDGGIAA